MVHFVEINQSPLHLLHAEITTSEKPFKTIEKKQLYYELFNFNLTVEYMQLYNFCLWNYLWTHNAYRLVVWKVFLFQILGNNSIFTLPGKYHFDKSVKMMSCVVIWIWMSPLTYWNLNSSSKMLVVQWLLKFKLV